MNLIQLSVALILVVGFALLVRNVNWSSETSDLFNLFNIRKGIKK